MNLEYSNLKLIIEYRRFTREFEYSSIRIYIQIFKVSVYKDRMEGKLVKSRSELYSIFEIQCYEDRVDVNFNYVVEQTT